jgi:SAM-dependent methyltransferase
VEPEYAERYRELYEKHWWWRAREEFIVETLRRFEPPAGWQRILDVGCGDGLFFDRLIRFGEVEGIEPAGAVVSANGPHRLRIHIGPFDESFQPGRHYRLVLMLDVLEHIAEPGAALRRALELLEPDGLLVATVPAFDLIWTSHDVLNRHLRRYTKRTFRGLAEGAGFRMDREQYLFQWLFPLKLALRVAEKLVHSGPAVPGIPPPWLNRTLYGLTRLEQKTLSALSPPFGSSLLAVARKPRD